MSAYFDKASMEAEKSIEDALVAEGKVVSDVLLVTGDREFPDDMRQKILGSIAKFRIDHENGATKGRQWYEGLGDSRLINVLHDLFHTLAQRKVETRFGVLCDKPNTILGMRDNYEGDNK